MSADSITPPTAIHNMNHWRLFDSKLALDLAALVDHPAPMEKQENSTYLERKNASTNLARFYEVTITLTLFGEFSVVRNWGRIGAKGKKLERLFSDHTEAEQYAQHYVSAKMRRGYERQM